MSLKNLDLLIPTAAPETDTWTWATVMDADPFRIRLDGDTDALDMEPERLYANPETGQRVWVQLTGRRVIVHAPNKGAEVGGDDGVPNDVSLTFYFATATKQWLINHNLGDPAPNVVLKDNAGNTVIGDVTYIDANTLRVDWYFDTNGSAIVSI